MVVPVGGHPLHFLKDRFDRETYPYLDIELDTRPDPQTDIRPNGSIACATLTQALHGQPKRQYAVEMTMFSSGRPAYEAWVISDDPRRQQETLQIAASEESISKSIDRLIHGMQ